MCERCGRRPATIDVSFFWGTKHWCFECASEVLRPVRMLRESRGRRVRVVSPLRRRR